MQNTEVSGVTPEVTEKVLYKFHYYTNAPPNCGVKPDLHRTHDRSYNRMGIIFLNRKTVAAM